MQYTVGAKLRKIREQLGYSYEDVASALDVSTSTINNVETGNNFPSFKLFAAMLMLYDVSLEDFGRGVTLREQRMYKKMPLEQVTELESLKAEIAELRSLLNKR